MGSVSTRSKENSSTLPVGSMAMWAAKSGDWKYSANCPYALGWNFEFASSWDLVRSLRLSIRASWEYPPRAWAAARILACS